MYKTAPEFLMMTACNAVLAGLAILLARQSVFAEQGAVVYTNSPTGLSSLARRQYLSGKKEESIALYQKAIEKAEQDYGRNSPPVGNLNYEMGVRAYDLCRFDLAERCLKKATAINPNSLSAQLMLSQLLRFRNQNGEAYRRSEIAVKKHWDASEARRDFMLCLQDVDPASAAQQAFIINCLQNGTVAKIPGHEVVQAMKKSQKPPPHSNSAEKMPTINQVDSKPANPKDVNKSVNKAASKKSNGPAKNTVRASSKTKNKSGKTHKAEHGSSLLVPPPPLPNWFGFLNPKLDERASPNTHAGLKAKADSIKKGKIAKPAASETAGEEAKPEAEALPQHSAKRSADQDSDFLLDWAAVKKKSAKK